MARADLCTKALLVVIAILLALNTLSQLRGPVVYAQPKPSQYGVELVQVRNSKQFQADLATAINDAAKGRELVTLVSVGPAGYLAVYK
jgi:hypothetical protein